VSPLPIDYDDFDFEHEFRYFSSGGGRCRRWVPVGMPRLSQRIKDTVFLLYKLRADSGSIADSPSGTGVFVSLTGPPNGNHRHIYAVSCWHVVKRDGASIVRVNTKDGGYRFIRLETCQWHANQNGDDLAIADVTDHILDTDICEVIPDEMFATRDFIKQSDVGIGEDGFMLGLLAGRPGKHRNLIAGRFGNVSMLADDEEPIKQTNGNLRPSHLFDIKSRPGFSGSPVFIFRTLSADHMRGADESFAPSDVLRAAITSYRFNADFIRSSDIGEYDSGYEEYIRYGNFVRLLGIHTDQLKDRVDVTSEADPNSPGVKFRIPNSLTIVVPAWRIISLLNEEKIAVQRKQRERDDMNRWKEEDSPSDGESTASIDADANLSHREDFTSLLNAAAKKRQQGDQTSPGEIGDNSDDS
jgi:hypothetical protein